MSYALKLSEDNRILSAWKVLPNGNYDGMPIVNTIPTGETQKENDVTNYLYIDGEYIYDPKPEPAPVEPAVEPSVWDELDAAYQAGFDEGYTEGVNTAYDQ